MQAFSLASRALLKWRPLQHEHRDVAAGEMATTGKLPADANRTEATHRARRPPASRLNLPASCVGIALSEHAVNDGPGFVAAEAAQVKAIADAFGFANAGQVVSRFAGVRAGRCSWMSP